MTVHEVPLLEQAEVRVASRHEFADGPPQKTRPITAAVCSAAFSARGSKSMRAASTAWTVSGTEKPGGS